MLTRAATYCDDMQPAWPSEARRSADIGRMVVASQLVQPPADLRGIEAAIAWGCALVALTLYWLG